MDPSSDTKLAIDGGRPVRTRPLPLEFPAVYSMGEEEIGAATRVLRSRSLYRYHGIDFQGETRSFEAEFASFLKIPHCLAVNSGTAALHVALSALGVGPGQEVVIPAYLWVSVAAAVINLGAIPVLADIDDSFSLDPRSVEERITPRTSGVILIHMSGAPADPRPIVEIARRHHLFLLEDCAQCAGGSFQGRKVGTFGDAATFSFQLHKNMTSGDGGCFVTADDRLYDRAVASHDVGYARDKDGRVLTQGEVRLWGRGYRMDELRAAVLRVQLRRLPQVIARMHHSKYRLRNALKAFPELRLRPVADEAGDTACFLIATYPSPRIARRVTEALRAEGLVTFPQGTTNVVMTDWGLHVYFNIPGLTGKASADRTGAPWTLEKNRESQYEYGRGSCPHADSLFERSSILAIPSCLTQQDEDDIIQAFHKVFSSGILG